MKTISRKILYFIVYVASMVPDSCAHLKLSFIIQNLQKKFKKK